MNTNIEQMSHLARTAIQNQDWKSVVGFVNSMLQADSHCAEAYFLMGLVEKVSNRPVKAAEAFEKTLRLDAKRYDAGIELANQYSIARRNGEVANLLRKYAVMLNNSPKYLDLAGTVYSDIGMPEKAWPLYLKANKLQPEIELFQANLAACGVYLGKVQESQKIYQELLKRSPRHQRNHFHLARLSKAEDDNHINDMKKILDDSTTSSDKNIFMYYALGKELEDLERWKESYYYYKKAGDAVKSVSNYNVKNDIDLIDKIIDVCSAEWLESGNIKPKALSNVKTPIFIVGLPRTGTTLTERIVSNHSDVESLGETQFLQMVLRRESGVSSVENMNPDMIEALADIDPKVIAKGYNDCISYRLGENTFFIDKLPFNFLFLGFIAKAWPEARIIHLKRNPMDACFSMYKQVFTWAYKFSYSLEDLGAYYEAYDRLGKHWSKVLQGRLIEVDYESLVTDTEKQTHVLLEQLGLEFQPDCLDFYKNPAPSATASSVQVREKTHSRSINRWKKFSKELQPLKNHLESVNISVE